MTPDLILALIGKYVDKARSLGPPALLLIHLYFRSSEFTPLNPNVDLSGYFSFTGNRVMFVSFKPFVCLTDLWAFILKSSDTDWPNKRAKLSYFPFSFLK